MAIKIKTKKEIHRGILGYRVLEVEALESQDLPKEYLEGYPCCYKVALWDSTDEMKIPVLAIQEGREPAKWYQLIVDHFYPKKEFERLLEVVKRCGDRLHEINAGLKSKAREFGVGGAVEFIV